jgi:hypothetical protein
VEAKMAFEKAILAAQRAVTDEVIARVTGLSVSRIRAVIRAA